MNQRDDLLGRLQAMRPGMQRLFAGSLPAELLRELGGVTLHQLDVLRLLSESESGTLTMSELAASQGVGPSAVTQMVDRLIREGLVERVPDDEDRRVVRVRPTPRSSAMIARVKTGRREAQRRVLAPLDDDELAQYVALTERIISGARVDEPRHAS